MDVVTSSEAAKTSACDGDCTEEKASDGEKDAYYSANFKDILRAVLDSSPERHVLSDRATKTANQFFELAEPYQQLYVRLYLRKHQWLRVANISYPDISPDVSPLAQTLVGEGFLDGESQLTDPQQILALLQVKELKALCKSLNLPPTSVTGGQKAAMISAILRHQGTHRPLFGSSSSFLCTACKKAKAILGQCVRVAEAPVEQLSRIVLLFSLSNSWAFEEDHSCQQIVYRMLQVKIGQVVYPEFEVRVTQPLFPTSQEFERFYAATKLEQQALLVVEKGSSPDDVTSGLSMQELSEIARCELDEEVARHTRDVQSGLGGSRPRFLLPFMAGSVYTHTLGHCVEHFEKMGSYQEACSLLRHLLSQEVFTSRRGRWWERLVLNLDQHLDKKEESLDAIEKALQDVHVRPHTRLTLLQRKQKICQQRARRKRGRDTDVCLLPPACEAGEEGRVIPEMPLHHAPEVFVKGKLCTSNSAALFMLSNQTGPHAIVSVEGYASHHYANQEGWPCILHAEGSVFATMFGLLMWDIVFAGGIDDVFRSPYQQAPLDLFTSEFFVRRKELIETRLDWLRGTGTESLLGEIEKTWNMHYGKACVGINWELFATQEDAKTLASCMGVSLLSSVCVQFALDYGHSAGGLPDLTLWNPKTLKCKFVEVKGPRDRLSSKQVVWLSRLMQWGADVEVCRVRANVA